MGVTPHPIYVKCIPYRLYMCRAAGLTPQRFEIPRAGGRRVCDGGDGSGGGARDDVAQAQLQTYLPKPSGRNPAAETPLLAGWSNRDQGDLQANHERTKCMAALA